MSTNDQIEKMLFELSQGVPTVYIDPAAKVVPHRDAVAASFGFEPRLRYLRYVLGFQRVLSSYTEFDFDVVAMSKGCTHVYYRASNFKDADKNLVRRQVALLLRETDVRSEYQIRTITLFGKHRYSYPD